MIKPYYDEDGITLYLGDCRDVLPTLGPVDHCITDPPYAEQTHKDVRSHKDFDASMLQDENWHSITVRELATIFSEVATHLARWCVATVDLRHMLAFEASPPEGLRFVRAGVWVKPNGSPQFTGDRPAMGWEPVAIFHKLNEKLRWNGGGGRAVWTSNRAREGFHPTQKPITLLQKWCELFTDPGETILDPFAGSGTTLVAAKMTGRRAIGIEREEKYAQIIVGRLSRPVLVPRGLLDGRARV